MAEDPLVAAARRLYGLPPADFTAARDTSSRELRAQGHAQQAKQVKQLRKPLAGAHLVNALARAEPKLFERLGELGERLRDAQDQGDARGLRELDRERRSLVTTAVDRASAVAQRDGSRATEASLRDVEQTLWAAVVDPDAFATVRAGMLVRPLAPGGFGSVDLTGASAVPVPLDEVARQRRRRAARKPVSKTAADPEPDAERRAREKAREEAARELARAEEALSVAERTASESARRVDEAADRLDSLRQELAELHDRVTAAESAIRETTAQQSDGTKELRAAERARRAAASEVDRARRRLDDLADQS